MTQCQIVLEVTVADYVCIKVSMYVCIRLSMYQSGKFLLHILFPVCYS